MKLSQRLQAIADLVDKGARVGDIGTDHGQLPCYLVENASQRAGLRSRSQRGWGMD